MNEIESAFVDAQQREKTLTSRPGIMDFVARAKYNAGAKIEGILKEESMRKYVEKINELLRQN
jgi:acyl-CoA-binding protein